MYYYKASFDQRTVSETHSDEAYGEWSRTGSNSFQSIEASHDGAYDAVKSNVNLVTQDGWLVWVETSSGDSFGSGSRTGVDAVGVFATKEAAIQCAEAVAAHGAERRNDGTFEFKSPDGNDVEMSYPPWADYFGGLDEVHVQRVNLHEHEARACKEESKITVHG